MTPLARKIGTLIAPLDDCYVTSGRTAPGVEAIEGAAMPQPYRDLLVHGRDMTSTLETFAGRRLHLRVLQKVLSDDDVLTRQVVLETDGDPEPFEFGAIRIYLQRFPDAARRRILECHRPLGAILQEHAIDYRCRPTGFFRFTSDQVATEAFGLEGPHRLYGRHTIITGGMTGDHPDDEAPVMAEVAEILPPLDGRAAASP